MANPITWKNIASTVDSGGVSTLMNGAQNAFSGAFDPLTDALEKRKEREASNVEQFRKNRKNEYLGMFENAQTVDELNELRDSGAARAFREAGGFDRTGTFGMYGQRLTQLNNNAATAYQHSERERKIAEAPILAEYERRVEVEGPEAANEWFATVEDQVANPGAVYGRGEEEMIQDWNYTNSRQTAARSAAQARRQAVLFQQGQDAIDRQNAGFDAVDGLMGGLLESEENHNALRRTAGMNQTQFPVTESGEIDFGALTPEQTEEANQYLEDFIGTNGSPQLNQTQLSNMLDERLKGLDLNGREREELQKVFMSQYKRATELSPEQQAELQQEVEYFSQPHNRRLEEIEQEIAGATAMDFKGAPIEESASNAVEMLASAPDSIERDNMLTRFFGQNNADQFKNLQEEVVKVRNQGISTRDGELEVPDFIEAMAFQQVKSEFNPGDGLFTQVANLTRTNDSLAQSYRDIVERLMEENAGIIGERMERINGLNKEQQTINAELKLGTNAIEGKYLRNNGKVNTGR